MTYAAYSFGVAKSRSSELVMDFFLTYNRGFALARLT